MNFSALTAPIPLTPLGAVAGAAWQVREASTTARSSALHVLGKVVMFTDGEGYARLVAPEAPGVHRGQPAPEETAERDRSTMLVRGYRPYAGRAVLRRGSATLAVVSFTDGGASTEVELSGESRLIPNADEGEWFVALGAERPDARKWCKLPRVGLVARWGREEPLVLGCELVAVCVASWTLSLVYRGTRLVREASAPQSIQLEVHALGDIIAMTSVACEGSAAPSSRGAPAPPIARIAPSAEGAPAPAELEEFSNEPTAFAEEDASGRDPPR